MTDTMPRMTHQAPVRVARVIEMTEPQYHHFAARLGEKAPFIAANQTLMYTDAQGISHCLLVTARNRTDGILVSWHR